MIKSIADLLVTYKDYKDPIGKISREMKKKNLFPVVKGLYETDLHAPGLYLSAYIYGPSYVSFEYALAYHGLIPERVVVYTNATFGKNRTKKYNNRFGSYLYRDVPKSAFPYGVKAYLDNGYSFLIATPEKALCDKLYISPPQTSMKQLKLLLFEDLRIDEDAFLDLNVEDLLTYCDLYPSTNLKLLKRILKKEYLQS